MNRILACLLAAALCCVFILYDSDKHIENYMDFVANTAEQCPLDEEAYSSDCYLVFTNSGSTHRLDIYDLNKKPNAEYGYMQLTSSQDEISECRIVARSYPDEKRSEVTIEPKDYAVSGYRMKTVFCDDCILKILEKVRASDITEVFLFDAGADEIYPLKDGTLALTNYQLHISSDEAGKYDIEVIYTGES